MISRKQTEVICSLAVEHAEAVCRKRRRKPNRSGVRDSGNRGAKVQEDDRKEYMEKFKNTWLKWNRKIDGIWADGEDRNQTESQAASGAEMKTRGARLAAWAKLHRFELLFVLAMGTFLFAMAWILPFNEAPDEEMRYMIPQYIYRHGTLPAGWDEEIRNEIWGISYGFHPILPYIFGGWLMRLVGIFNDSPKALLMAARLINVLIGMGFYWYVLQIAKKLFANRLFRNFFIALLALLPQLLYLFMYVNTDGIAVFSSAIIIYYWLEGLEHRWNRRTCTGLAVGVSVCALSYFNAYGYALFSVILFVGSLAVLYGKRGAKNCTEVILKRGLYITALVFLLTGWWFIRCAVLYDGDFLGLHAPDKYGEMYAMEEFKPSNKLSLAEQDVPLEEMLRSNDGGMEWIRTTYRSTIGYFGYFKYALGLDIYEIHKKLMALGLLGCVLLAGQFLLSWLPKSRMKGMFLRYKNCEMHPISFCLLQFSLGCCIIIPVLLSLYYSYCSDFQPQGRYIMPMIVPLMYFVAVGIQRVVTLFFRKWFVYVMMIPLFYAVLHVFFGAFVSVYVPAFVETLASWGDIRFPWFSNFVWLHRLIGLFIPG